MIGPSQGLNEDNASRVPAWSRGSDRGPQVTAPLPFPGLILYNNPVVPARRSSPFPEVHRTPPKTQAALLQAMQERQVTVGQDTYSLPEPFFVIATQNPIEQEGTYPLPEAQLDRFMFDIKVDYPSVDEEKRILATTTKGEPAELAKVLSAKAILNMQKLVRSVPVGDYVNDYIVRLVRA